MDRLFFLGFFMQQEWSIEYPQTLQNDFLALYCRYGMTPTCISSILMHVILPAKWLYPHQEKQNQPIDKKIENKNSQKYIVYFGGNAQNCVDLNALLAHVPGYNSANIVFWNYPGVGNSTLPSHSPEDLYLAGYSVVHELIVQGVSADNILLNGLSLGGHVASEVARRLYREGHFVDLYVDRTFSTVAAVIPEALAGNNISMKGIYVSSILAGIAPMLMFSGLQGSIVNTITLVSMNAFAMMGYCMAFAIQSIGIILQEMMSTIGFEKVGAYVAMPFMELGNLVNQIINFIAQSLYDLIWWIVGIASIAILLPMLLSGLVMGLVCGSLLSLQLLWTDKPMIIPSQMLIEGALLINSCTMNTVSAIEEIIELNREKKGNITIINTSNDDVIYPKASLCEGMGFFLNNPQEEQQPLNDRVKYQWYGGDHIIYLGRLIK